MNTAPGRPPLRSGGRLPLSRLIPSRIWLRLRGHLLSGLALLVCASAGLTPVAAAPRSSPAHGARVALSCAPGRSAQPCSPARTPVTTDSRVRTVPYDPGRVYSLTGVIGYQIDLEFEAGELFIGLGAGDVEGLAFEAQGNHLFLKPRAAEVHTNLTVLTTRRVYLFDYVAGGRPGAGPAELLYSPRFTYPPPPQTAQQLEAALAQGQARRPLNLHYGYCGAPSLKPVAAMDDGVHTRLRFGARSELPAVFVQNEDGSESLVNYSIEAGDVLVHRVVRRLILRRGVLAGCVVNQSYNGGGERLESGTVAPGVEREGGSHE